MASNKQNQKNLREIYDLLDKLVRKFCHDRHKEVLKKVTSGIVESQYGFFSNVQLDESIVLAKIKNHLANKSQTSLAIFLKQHEELSTLADSKFRTSMLTFLLCMTDMEVKLPNNIDTKESATSSFTLPIRSIQNSASMEQIYRNITTSRVSLQLIATLIDISVFYCAAYSKELTILFYF